jgi:hypothetical protein
LHWDCKLVIHVVRTRCAIFRRRSPFFGYVQVAEEFANIVPCDASFADKWRIVRDKILTHAESISSRQSDVDALLKELKDDEFDEGKLLI